MWENGEKVLLIEMQYLLLYLTDKIHVLAENLFATLAMHGHGLFHDESFEC